MEQDEPMDQDEPPKPDGAKANGDGLEQYNLDDYDEDEAMPGELTHILVVYYSNRLPYQRYALAHPAIS